MYERNTYKKYNFDPSSKVYTSESFDDLWYLDETFSQCTSFP